MRYTFIIVWIFTILTSTVGVSVNSIYCYCKGQTGIAFSLKPAAFAKSEGETTCCTTLESGCATTASEAHTDKPCKSGASIIKQLDFDISLEKTESISIVCLGTVTKAVLPDFPSIFSLKKEYSPIDSRGPPLLLGQAFFSFIQSWLL